MKKIVIFTGAGISAESGLGTFRDAGGLWDEYNIEDVATYDAFVKDPELVLEFYNIRRRQLLSSYPNAAHISLNKLKNHFNLLIVTQNIDDLHERSGSKNVLHLHGKLRESRSVIDNKIYQIDGAELNLGDKCDKGGQLRPNVVWFGEDVPEIQTAIQEVRECDILIIIGTSLNVYPAASLIDYAEQAKRIVIIDPNSNSYEGIEVIKKKASVAVPELVDQLLGLVD